MNASHRCITAIVLWMATCWACQGAWAREEFEDWNLETSLGQAHLVMVARVTSISRITVVEGAKTDVALRSYRFQPVRVLKGLFQRDELSMTASDLGIAADSTSPPLNEGEFRLMILVQQRGITSYGCVTASPGATSFAERVPLLSGQDDPLVAVAETLIKVADSRSRGERARLLIERLADTRGIAAVPLLTSLRLRTDWAGDADLSVLAELARDPLAAVRSGAVEVLRGMFATGSISNDPAQLANVAEALDSLLESDESNTQIRLAAIEALGQALAARDDGDRAREMLVQQLNGAATYAERAAAFVALARVARPGTTAFDAMLDGFAALPLDERTERELVYCRALMGLKPVDSPSPAGVVPAAERVLLDRLERSLAARQSLEAEIDVLSRVRSVPSLPLLLAAAKQPNISPDERAHIAIALGRLGNDQAVPVLVEWLRDDNYQVKDAALSALELIDSPVVANEIRPQLKKEANLSSKLRIARLLARHGLNDGYALATEHLADSDHTAAATLVLVALNDPRTVDDLSAILATRPDRTWHAAALTGLAAVGNQRAQDQLLEILNDDRHPLVVSAAQAAGLSGTSELLAPLARLVSSRNEQIASMSLVSLRRYLSDVRQSPVGLAAAEYGRRTPRDRFPTRAPNVEMPEAVENAIAEAVDSLVADTYVNARLRSDALEVARLIGAERYEALLTELADQSELEGTDLLETVQFERLRLRELD